jgi:pimeloyl-ACP methyl ester carboxylesterase/DNA-binding CsgD family transcriptional regulator
VNQTIRFARSVDGVRIAFAESGSGPPLVKAANWLSHLEFDWQSPVWSHWFRFLSSRHRLIRYDERGCGLSDWHPEIISLDAHVADLEVVVNAAGLERFALLGISQGGAIATEYALRHPERVSQLVLYGAFARGRLHRDDEASRQHRALNDLVLLGWRENNPAYRRLFASLFVPDASDEQERWFSDLMRISSDPNTAARIAEAAADFNIAPKLPGVAVPTLVIHARDEAAVPLSEGLLFASGIPGAQFVALEGRNHILLESEPAWNRFCEEFSSFVGDAGQGALRSEPNDAVTNEAVRTRLEQLTERELVILTYLARGLSNAEIAQRVYISEKTVRNHLTSIFSKLDVDSRAKAIVLAHASGLAR